MSQTKSIKMKLTNKNRISIRLQFHRVSLSRQQPPKSTESMLKEELERFLVDHPTRKCSPREFSLLYDEWIVAENPVISAAVGFETPDVAATTEKRQRRRERQEHAVQAAAVVTQAIEIQ